MSRDETQRTLRVSKAVKVALVELRLLEQSSAVPELDAGKIDAAERALDTRLPDDLLATFAAGCDVFRELGISLDRITTHTADARAAGCPPELVAIGRTEAPTYLCFSRREGDQIVEFDPEDKKLTKRALADWLSDLIDQRKSDLGTTEDEDEPEDPDTADVEVGKADLDSFKPRVVAPPKATGKQVRHATFGVGDVLREIGTGASRKLEVRFPTGTKVLIARVLEEL